MVTKTKPKKTTRKPATPSKKKPASQKKTSVKRKSTTTKKTTATTPKRAPVKKATHFPLMDISTLPRTPFPHQLEAATFLLEKKKAILGDDMGLGKSFSSIIALNSIKGKRLIVCPSSLKLNWKKEIQMVSNDPIHIISNQAWIKPARNSWVIINYDILHNHLEDIKKANFLAVAFDEAHYVKNVNNHGKPGTKRAKYFMRIANQMEYVFLLTGTPISNKTKDIFNLLKAIKHPVSKDFKVFSNRFCDPQFNGFGYTYNGSTHQEELHDELKGHLLRRLKDDVLDLPKKMRSFIPVEIHLQSYNQKVDDYMTKRSQINGRHEHLVYLNALRHLLAKEKITHTKHLVQDLLDQNKPTVVFTAYTAVVEALCEAFPEAVTVIGDNSEEERQQAVNDFQNGKTNLIVCNLIAGGTGITLTRAKNLIIQDFDWTPSTSSQAEDRIYRIGQNENVNIYYVYAEGTIDEKMALLLEDKLLNINKIIDDSDVGFLDEIINWFDVYEEPKAP